METWLFEIYFLSLHRNYFMIKKEHITILHISDLHLDSSGSSNNKKEQKDVLKRMVEKIGLECGTDTSWNPDFVVITGDIANRALEADYKLFGIDCDSKYFFFDDLFNSIGFVDKVSDYKRVIVIPGNHDKEISEKFNTIKKVLHNKIIAHIEGSKNIDAKSQLEYVRSIIDSSTGTERELLVFLSTYFHRFNMFCKSMGFSQPETQFNIDENVFTHGVHNFAEYGISFMTINSAFTSLSGDVDYGKLELHEDSVKHSLYTVENIRRNNADLVNICMLHHPVTWLAERSQLTQPYSRAIFDEVLDESELVFAGHQHINKSGIPDILNFRAPLIVSGSAYKKPSKKKSSYRNSFNIIKLDLKEETFSTRSMVYSDLSSSKPKWVEEETVKKWPLFYGEKMMFKYDKMKVLEVENKQLQDKNKQLQDETDFLLAQIYPDKKTINT